jgi:hypothetical protein
MKAELQDMQRQIDDCDPAKDYPEFSWDFVQHYGDLRAALAQQKQGEPVATDPLHDDAYLRAIALGFPVGDARRWTLCRIADRIEQKQGEPVASLMTHLQSGDVELVWNDDGFDRAMWAETPLYTSPPPRKRLTDEQIMDLPAGVNNGKLSFLLRFARAVERAHGIGDEHE